MATLSEHAENIRAAIQAAALDGYSIEFEVYRNRFESCEIDSIDLEIHEWGTNDDGRRYVVQYGTLYEGNF